MDDTDALQKIIDQLITDNPTQVAEYKAGKVKMISFFIGQVMRQTKGKANPALVNQLLDAALAAWQ